VKGLSSIGLGNVEEGLNEIEKSLGTSNSIRHARWIREGTFVDVNPSAGYRF